MLDTYSFGKSKKYLVLGSIAALAVAEPGFRYRGGHTIKHFIYVSLATQKKITYLLTKI